MRLDAVPYLYEEEGTNCENLPETHGFLKKLRSHVDERHPNRMLLAEANQWPEDAVAYFGEGDECHMSFHFPLMPRLFMATRMEDRFPVVDILEQTPEIPEMAQWAIFLRNHDELTLEMVTDEERDYMYRAYAQDARARVNLGIRRRLAPLLRNNRKKIELLNGLLFSLPGSPVIYYGDEIGMGDNIYLGDRNGVRTPMQWSGDRNAGFSDANPQRLYLPVITDPEYRYEAVNVESQQDNPSSLLWWVKRLVSLRQRYDAFGRGELRLLGPENRKVLAFVREHGEERILVVANLSRFAQHVELDLSEFAGTTPMELFGHTEFPAVTDQPYPLTLGPHAFYWLALEPAGEERPRVVKPAQQRGPERLRAPSLEALVTGEATRELERALPAWLEGQRWFGAKTRRMRDAEIREAIPVEHDGSRWYLLMAEISFVDHEPERYSLTLGFASGAEAYRIGREHPDAVVAPTVIGGEEGVLHEALASPGFCQALLSLVSGERRIRGQDGWLSARAGDAVERTLAGTGPVAPPPGGTEQAEDALPAGGAEDGEAGDAPEEEALPSLEPRVFSGEQSNSSVVYGDSFILKLYRRLEPGIHPDLEVTRFLTDRGFPHTPELAGDLVYRAGRRGPEVAMGTLQSFVESQGDAWEYTLDSVERYFERALADGGAELPTDPLGAESFLRLAGSEVPPGVRDQMGPYLDSAWLLGRRTGELHAALHAPGHPDFSSQGFGALARRSHYQSMRNLVGRTFRTLDDVLPRLPEPIRGEAERVAALRDEILERSYRIVRTDLSAVRIRCHGDYHLGQILYTGKDFVILDFEGEPARPLNTRRSRKSALTDVAGMTRSFHYAAYAALFEAEEKGLLREADLPRLQRLARGWTLWASATFLEGYLEEAGQQPFVPEDEEELVFLLDFFQLEKAVYELGYDIDNRPDWVRIPVEGIRELMGDTRLDAADGEEAPTEPAGPEEDGAEENGAEVAPSASAGERD
jgi:maltose alpha-D-glucosyltransferase/alpha-amylase